MARPYLGAMAGMGGLSHSSVSIDKAENGYMITLQPAMSDLDVLVPMMGQEEFPDPSRIAELRKEQKKILPRTFVFSDLEKAWDAIREFLLDGRMPKAS